MSITGDWRKKELLRFDEVMAILDVKSKNTIYNLLRDGKLLAHNRDGSPGRRGVRIITSSLVAYLTGGTISPEKWIE